METGKCLVTIPFTREQKNRILEAGSDYEIIFCKKNEVTEDMLERVEILLGNLPVDLVKKARHLKWMQTNSAGVNLYIPSGVLKEDTLLSSAVGAYDISVTEGMIAGTMALYRKMPAYMESQKAHVWKDEGPLLSPYGATVLIVGLGQIGCRYANVMKAMGSHIIGIKRDISRKPEGIDEVYTMEHLQECLARADLVASILPATEATKYTFGTEEFAKMKRSAYFLNFGRGFSVVTDALCDALCKGEIAGACLDVTDPEPLPADHPLWNAPNLILTPHVAGSFHIPVTLEIICDICVENLKHYKKGEKLRNQISREIGY